MLAVESKFKAVGSVQPITTGKHDPSSVFAFGSKLNANGSVHPKIGYIHPNGTTAFMWYYILKHRFDNLKVMPQEVFIQFRDRHLFSKNPSDEELRMLVEISTFKQILEIISKEKLRFDKAMKILLFKNIYLFRYAKKIQLKVLSYLKYGESTIRKINGNLKRNYNDKNSSYDKYHHITNLLELLSKYDTKIIMSTVFTGDNYEVEKSLSEHSDKFISLPFESKNNALVAPM